jgi:hypothetical protein
MTSGTDIEMGFDMTLGTDDPLRRIAAMRAKTLTGFKRLIAIPALAFQQPVAAGLAQVCRSVTRKAAMGTAFSFLHRLFRPFEVTLMAVRRSRPFAFPRTRTFFIWSFR